MTVKTPRDDAVTRGPSLKSTIPPARVLPETIQDAVDRATSLQPAYARAVQKIIGRGSPMSFDLLVLPVDRAREAAEKALAGWHKGEASEQEVVEAHDALAALKRMVIG